MAPSLKPKCIECYHFHEVPENPAVGICRRHPPKVHFITVPRRDLAAGGVVPAIEQVSAQPTTSREGCCGEFVRAVQLIS